MIIDRNDLQPYELDLGEFALGRTWKKCTKRSSVHSLVKSNLHWNNCMLTWRMVLIKRKETHCLHWFPNKLTISSIFLSNHADIIKLPFSVLLCSLKKSETSNDEYLDCSCINKQVYTHKLEDNRFFKTVFTLRLKLNLKTAILYRRAAWRQLVTKLTGAPHDVSWLRNWLVLKIPSSDHFYKRNLPKNSLAEFICLSIKFKTDLNYRQLKYFSKRRIAVVSQYE